MANNSNSSMNGPQGDVLEFQEQSKQLYFDVHTLQVHSRPMYFPHGIDLLIEYQQFLKRVMIWFILPGIAYLS